MNNVRVMLITNNIREKEPNKKTTDNCMMKKRLGHKKSIAKKYKKYESLLQRMLRRTGDVREA